MDLSHSDVFPYDLYPSGPEVRMVDIRLCSLCGLRILYSLTLNQ